MFNKIDQLVMEAIAFPIIEILKKNGELYPFITFTDVLNKSIFSFEKEVALRFSINRHTVVMCVTKDWSLGVFRSPKHTVSFYVPDLRNMDGHTSEFSVSASNGIFNLGDDVCNHIKNCLSPKLKNIPSGETAFSHSLKHPELYESIDVQSNSV